MESGAYYASTDMLNSDLVDTLKLVCEAALEKQRLSRKPRYRSPGQPSSRRSSINDPDVRLLDSNTLGLDCLDGEDSVDLDDILLSEVPNTPREIQAFRESGPDSDDNSDSRNDLGFLNNADTLDSLLSSIALYKRATKSSLENCPLLPTKDSLAQCMSALEEVSRHLAERFTPTQTADLASLHPCTLRRVTFEDDLPLFTPEKVAGELAL
jgi:hypothetical protein